MIATFLNNRQENSESFNKVLVTSLGRGEKHVHALFFSHFVKSDSDSAEIWAKIVCVCVSVHMCTPTSLSFLDSLQLHSLEGWYHVPLLPFLFLPS